MKSEDEIQKQLAYWDSEVANVMQASAQGHKVPEDEGNKVTEARFRIQDLIWCLGSGEAGEASRKFSVSSAVLAELFGDADAGGGQELREKYYANKDKNSRYQVRKKLLKEAESGRYTSWKIF